MKLKFVFRAGWRKVTVTAYNYHEADLKARAELDRRCENGHREPPVGWTLELMRATP